MKMLDNQVAGRLPGFSRVRDLADSVVVVTGAASGIGAATTDALVRSGARVVAEDLNLSAAVERHGHWDSDRVVAVAADVADPEASRSMIAAGMNAWGRVDSVLANAGAGYFGGIHDYGVEQIQRMVSTNLLGTIWLARAAVEHYRQEGAGGDIVIIASAAGMGMGAGNEAVYAATKAGQIQFGTSLDREVRREGIHVAVVAPAAVNTAFAASTGRFGDTPIEEGPFMQPADIADAVLMCLAQPRSMRTAIWALWGLAENN